MRRDVDNPLAYRYPRSFSIARDLSQSPVPDSSVEFARSCRACLASGSSLFVFLGAGSVAQPAKRIRQMIHVAARQPFQSERMLTLASAEGKFETEMSQNHALPSRSI